jgi:hypothetical protein
MVVLSGTPVQYHEIGNRCTGSWVTFVLVYVPLQASRIKPDLQNLCRSIRVLVHPCSELKNHTIKLFLGVRNSFDFEKFRR